MGGKTVRPILLVKGKKGTKEIGVKKEQKYAYTYIEGESPQFPKGGGQGGERVTPEGKRGDAQKPMMTRGGEKSEKSDCNCCISMRLRSGRTFHVMKAGKKSPCLHS